MMSVLEYSGPEKEVSCRKTLSAGSYRFRFGFKILSNDHDNRDLLQASVSLAGSDRVLAKGSLPRKKEVADSPYNVFHVDFTLEETAEVEGHLRLSSAGRVAIDEAEIVVKKLPPLPESPQLLLINPDRNLSAEKIVHQGMAAIATYLETQGIYCHLANTSQCDDDFILQQVREYPYGYVGFFVTSDGTIVDYVRGMLARIKEIRPEIVALAGGPHATLDAEKLLQDVPDLAVCVRGEGEETCCDILQGVALDAVRGITYRRDDGRLASNP